MLTCYTNTTNELFTNWNNIAMTEAMTTPLKNVGQQLTDKCVHVLAAYRKHCATATSPGQVSEVILANNLLLINNIIFIIAYSTRVI
jgi:hypothetical protein